MTLNNSKPFNPVAGWLAILSLLLLRLCIGLHFFAEGSDKLRSGNFDATGFLGSASGPAAPWFRALLDDPDGQQLFGVVQRESGDASPSWDVEPTLTVALWRDFADRCDQHYRFGDPELQQELIDRRAEWAAQITAARSRADRSVDTRELERKRTQAEADLKRLRAQKELAGSLVESHAAEFLAWQNSNRTALISHFSTAGRENGFDKDGELAGTIAVEVASLREQTAKIASDRKAEAGKWKSEVRAIWDSLELALNDLAVDRQRSLPPVSLHRPFAQATSPIQWINRIIPWFDLVVGSLLVVGLFPRWAALAGALFLASVILTQPPWLPGSPPTWYQAVEMFALLMLSTGVGSLIPGLGWLVPKLRSRPAVPQSRPATA